MAGSEAPQHEQLLPAEDFTNLQRVKVYRLNDSGHWDDKGTGHVSCEYMEQSDSVGLVVVSEEDQQPLLVHRISREDIYQRQGGDTIITWTDPDINTDIALSFQEAVGCNYIWEQIKGAVDEYEFGSAPGDSFYQDSAERTGPSELPPAELGTMSELVKIVVDCSPFAREKIASLVLQNGYLRKLLDLFKTCEDLDDQDGLHMMYRLVRGLVLLNDAALFDELLRDDNVMDVVGALEYDPDLPVERTQHRVFLRDSVVFKEVVPIQDADVRAKIHQTYRIGYLKDVILPRVLDDATFGTLTSIMLFNNVEVVLALQNDPTFLKELFARLDNTPRTNPDWDDLVGFLQELCSLAKHLQIQQRGSLFAALVQHGLFYVLTDVLKTDSESSQLKGADVLMSTLHNDPSALRAFLVKQDQHALFERIVTLFVEGEEGLQAQLFELLKLMLDPETMDQPVEKSGFLELFYDTYVDRLVTSVNAGVRDEPGPGGGEGGETNSVVPAWALVKTIELLCFCVQHHSFRIKYYVLRNNVVEKVLKLTQRREKYLVVAAVRFLRACVGLKDEFYNRYIIKNALFAPVVKVFTANGTRYNMLNSAVLELVDFIRRENIKNLIVHLVELYDPVFAEVTYVDTFRLLKLRYQQGQQPPGTGDAIGEGDQQTQGAGAGEGEEDYFKEDDDDDEPGASNGGNGGGGDDVGFTAPREPGGEAAAGTSGAGKRALDEGSEGDGAGKKSRTDEPPAEGLTAAQRNAARGLEKVTPPSEDAGKPAEDPPESERNPKPTSKPTSSWVSVDE
ncbi:uncharacterized protein MICPUCDRAFT_19362 [Micromonas pusilla CCMP1545]|uniref:Predicted protein n=1 Tax=Micromonas pusilla (strain CCMP1545) TaxID=564608 RepID=C1MYR1_MICPC|nr:uncharacterized protein MICPUCDRAFT_19362 [Micromonas pusilla CCMP1545]EEH55088.1 predicted protein [Micromonas pusilla CCMP1545]|eukprot:XP_003060319.1 predicted protein [Micromonas pusilla CCMP1545]